MSATTIDVFVTSPPVVDVHVVSDPVFELLGVLPTGPRGAKGDDGDPGADGQGVPIGGTESQVLAKASAADFDAQWVDQTGGGGGSGVVETIVEGAGITVDDTDPANPIVGAEVTQAELDAEATTRAAVATALDGRLDVIEAISIATDAELAAEAALARNADNLTSGTVADARIASTIARDSEVSTAVAAEATARDSAIATAVAGYQPLDSDLTVIAAANNSAVLAGTTASFLTAHATKLGFVTVTQAVDLDAIETRVNDLDAAVVLRGSWDASAGTFPGGGTAQAGASYIVSVAGTVDGVAFAVGDRVIAITDNASTTTFASNWFKADYTDQVLSVNGRTGAVTGLAEASDLTAETSRATTAEGLLAPKASPALTGNPTAPTASPGDNDTSIATTAFVTAADVVVQTAAATDATTKANAKVDDTAFAGLWDGVTTVAPSKNAVYDKLMALVKGDVGLGNVDNTSDANKPVSTAQQTALDLKLDIAAVKAAGTTNARSSKVTADANNRFQQDAAGKSEWGDGTAAVDTNLYRAAADSLKTDDSLSAQQFRLNSGGLAYYDSAVTSYMLYDGSATGIQCQVIAAAVGRIPMLLQAASGQTADIQRFMASNGTTIMSRVNKAGYLISRLTAAPADADLSANDLTFWLDNTAAAPTVRAKMKDSAGTVSNQTLLSAAAAAAAYQPLNTDLTDLVARWVPASAAGPASLDFAEDTDNGTNILRLIAPSSIASDKTQTLPDTTGTVALLETGSRVIAETHAAVTKSNSAAEETVASLVLPGGTVAVGDRVIFRAWGTLKNSSGSAVTYLTKLKVGTAVLTASSAASAASSADRRGFSVEMEVLFPTLSTQSIYGMAFAGNALASGSMGVIGGLFGMGATLAGTEASASNITFAVTVTMGTAVSTAEVVVDGASLELMKKP